MKKYLNQKISFWVIMLILIASDVLSNKTIKEKTIAVTSALILMIIGYALYALINWCTNKFSKSDFYKND